MKGTNEFISRGFFHNTVIPFIRRATPILIKGRELESPMPPCKFQSHRNRGSFLMSRIIQNILSHSGKYRGGHANKKNGFFKCFPFSKQFRLFTLQSSSKLLNVCFSIPLKDLTGFFFHCILQTRDHLLFLF